MSYISLYRKYRPKKFSDVVGQEVVVKILKNSIINNKIGHAYIFSGPRGTGKTSIAKIFSKVVNCLSNENGDLCEKCEICKLNFDDEIDIIEIDAASNNGVDEIREIRNNVKLLPVHLKYKVYIIDEVHMLSTSAFNALLKTLEEPPENIIFILATTEFNKIPATVVSRCQKFDFKKLTQKQISDRIKYILKEEKRQLSSDVIDLISEISDGGLRDGINLLDQLLSMNKEDISIDDVYNLIGEVAENKIFEIFDNIITCNIKEVLKNIDELYNSGKNLINICDKLQLLIRNIIIYENTNNYFDKKYEKSIDKYKNIDTNKLLELSKEIFNLINDLKKTGNQKTIMEIYFLKMSLIFNDSNESLLSDFNKKENKNEKEACEEEKNDIINIKINNTLFGASKSLKNEFIKKYSSINEYVSSKEFNAISNLLLKATPEIVSDKNIIFSFQNKFDVILFMKNEEEIKKLLKEIYNIKYSVVAISTDECEKIKKEYINNTKKGIKYEYIEEKKINKNKKLKNQLESTAESIFGEDLIKID